MGVMQNDIKDVFKMMVNEKMRRAGERLSELEGGRSKAGLRLFLSCFPCLGDSSFS